MKIEFDIHDETVDRVVAKVLRESADGFKQDYANAGGRTPVFSFEPEEERALCREHFEACRLLLSWFGTPDEWLQEDIEDANDES